MDTSFVLDLAGRGGRKRQHAADAMLASLAAEGERFTTTHFTLAELYVGVERSDEPQRELQRLEQMLSIVRVLPFDDPCDRIFGRVKGRLLDMGRPVGDVDLLIASISLANAQRLVTGNPKHFVDVPGLMVLTYVQ